MRLTGPLELMIGYPAIIRRHVLAKSDASMPMRIEPSKVSTTSTHLRPQLLRSA
jgi:hypothetical protein